jgi:hypothetical protein
MSSSSSSSSSCPALEALPAHVRAAALSVWDFHHVGHSDALPRPADIILALGSNDPRVAVRAAELFLDGFAPLLAFSGGVGRMTEGLYGGLSEAAYFARIAVGMGVPEERILVEGKSTNTGENLTLTLDLLRQKGLDPTTFIVVQKPYMELRSLLTCKRRLPEGKRLFVTSPRLDLAAYANDEDRLPLRLILCAMCGDLQRCRLYATPPRDFQAPVEIPAGVWEALKVLARAGYTDQLIVADDDGEGRRGGSSTRVYEGLEDL